jgi:hypothetical protein
MSRLPSVPKENMLLYLDKELTDWARQYKEKEGVPVSVLVNKLLREFKQSKLTHPE